ncbi:MAG: hypothetical protein Q8R15_02215, partial [Candidatus Micrarchaeota archaeon]|nr:hypothetical protein [Candidatus Micrarchaeota archaeon]
MTLFEELYSGELNPDLRSHHRTILRHVLANPGATVEDVMPKPPSRVEGKLSGLRDLLRKKVTEVQLRAVALHELVNAGVLHVKREGERKASLLELPRGTLFHRLPGKKQLYVDPNGT